MFVSECPNMYLKHFNAVFKNVFLFVTLIEEQYGENFSTLHLHVIMWLRRETGLKNAFSFEHKYFLFDVTTLCFQKVDTL